MTKIMLATLMLFSLTKIVYSETYIQDYGYYENSNEISAKNRLIGALDNIYDFENSANPGGESLENGRYYLETKYKGGNNGIDADYVYLDELLSQPNTQTIQNNSNIQYNKQLINANTQTINQNSKDIADNSNRIGKLEESQFIIGGKIRLYDSRKWQVSTFADYSTNRNMIDRLGVRFTFKFGESYEEKQINKLMKEIQLLKEKL